MAYQSNRIVDEKPPVLPEKPKVYGPIDVMEMIWKDVTVVEKYVLAIETLFKEQSQESIQAIARIKAHVVGMHIFCKETFEPNNVTRPNRKARREIAKIQKKAKAKDLSKNKK